MELVGIVLGLSEGEKELGISVGDSLGISVGDSVGIFVGDSLGDSVGDIDGNCGGSGEKEGDG